PLRTGRNRACDVQIPGAVSRFVSRCASAVESFIRSSHHERVVKVAVIGLGYVGVPLAAAVAATGATVVGIDIDSDKVESINAGRSPLRGREPGLNELVKATVSKRKFHASLDPAD